jgi:hypothetical protein
MQPQLDGRIAQNDPHRFKSEREASGIADFLLSMKFKVE